ncbi:MAG: phosphate ABC transporter substrate-binding/OmpA family protein [Planctomycetota bacterium]|nr:phosphate ABC transporter substrate-binding/OmpA family protein [Planctomycetota bacterium]MCX8040056.1 phosphate ABC transporter substrate-binding/OmpA family protein [Planctomycetota bacterium]MDW8373850.1 phosphate ABC transporter substrate-binding/OmpA family protein [Planctomycetota bacterium]
MPNVFRLLALLAACLAVPAGELVAPRASFPDIGQAGAYQPSGAIEVDISEYAGYAGLIVANGGLESAADSFVSKQYGLRLRLRLSESENWRAVHEGRIAATVTTADVLPLLGPRLNAVVPVLLSYSRGADGLIVRSDIKRINDLVGQTVVVTQFVETEFFLRYLAQEADIPVAIAGDGRLRSDAINLVFAADGFAAGDAFAADIESGARRFAGCVTWAPKTTEIVAASSGAARQLLTNRNLLIIADVLLVNAGFARAQPRALAALVHAALEGARRLRQDPERWLPIVQRAFGWDAARARDELAKVHLANRAENLAFFSGAMDAAGSFAYITQAAALVYEPYLPAGAPDCQRLVDTSALQALGQAFADDRVDIRPQGGEQAVEPVLARDIRFQFEDGTTLSRDAAGNQQALDRIAQWLRSGPGSSVVLIGHVEPTQRAELEKKLGRIPALMAARRLGQDRADAVKRMLVETRGVDPARIVTQTRGWEQPLPQVSDPVLNRRVEVQWRIAQ